MIIDEIKSRLIQAGIPEECSAVLFQEEDAFGHYSTNAPFSIAKQKGISPKDVAEEICKNILKSNDGFFASVDVAGAGFVNFHINPAEFQKEISLVINNPDEYGKNKSCVGKKARVEFVSANPTGPIHIGNARGGPYGETLSKTLEWSGYKVFREYLHNDAGTQVEKLGATIWHWYQKEMGIDTEFPEGGYAGEYPHELARAIISKLGDKLSESDIPKMIELGLEIIYKENFEVLEKLGISFDLIKKESELLSSGETMRIVSSLRERGILKESEGALWFAPKDEFLEDREAVVVRSNGKPTYFASDIAYHKEKFESGYDLVIDIFGSNHHGHVPKLRALTHIFGFDSDKFIVLLYQFVRVKRGSEILKMSKRAGTYITAKEVLEEVGPDAMTYSLLSNAQTTHVDFDLEAMKEQSMKNPVYYVQYAYVRAKSVLGNAECNIKNADLSLLSSDCDIKLMRLIAEFPEIILAVSKNFEVQHYIKYGFELARAFHNFYEKERVSGEEEKIKNARGALVYAFLSVLKNLFSIIHISLPEKM